MADISQMTISKAIFIENFCVSNTTSLKYVSYRPNDQWPYPSAGHNVVGVLSLLDCKVSTVLPNVRMIMHHLHHSMFFKQNSYHSTSNFEYYFTTHKIMSSNESHELAKCCMRHRKCTLESNSQHQNTRNTNKWSAYIYITGLLMGNVYIFHNAAMPWFSDTSPLMAYWNVWHSNMERLQKSMATANMKLKCETPIIQVLWHMESSIRF